MVCITVQTRPFALKGYFQDKPELFSKKIIARSVKYCFPMCSGVFEVNKNIILQFAKFVVSQSHLEDDGSDAPRLLGQWHFLYDVRAHTL